MSSSRPFKSRDFRSSMNHSKTSTIMLTVAPRHIFSFCFGASIRNLNDAGCNLNDAGLVLVSTNFYADFALLVMRCTCAIVICDILLHNMYRSGANMIGGVHTTGGNCCKHMWMCIEVVSTWLVVSTRLVVIVANTLETHVKRRNWDICVTCNFEPISNM